jgi:hypothetical protein
LHELLTFLSVPSTYCCWTLRSGECGTVDVNLLYRTPSVKIDVCCVSGGASACKQEEVKRLPGGKLKKKVGSYFHTFRGSLSSYLYS